MTGPLLPPKLPPNTPLRSRILIGSAIGFLLLFAPVALGGYQPGGQQPYGGGGSTTGRRYSPPPPSGTSGTVRGSTGTRGTCDSTSETTETTLTILAPVSHTGRTNSTRPTFAWFLSKAKSQPVEFSLYEYVTDSKVKRIYKTNPPLPASEGIMQFTLPETEPELVAGRRYLWQVALLCNLNHPANDLVAAATIDVVAAPPNLKTALSATTDRLQKAQLYAASSFWYDALAETLDNPKAQAFRLSLLRDLEQLETPKDAKATNEQSNQLKQVIAIEARSSFSIEQRPNPGGTGTR